MADEVNDDPITALAQAHTKRMQEIADESFADAKDVCDSVVTTIRKFSGLKSALLDRAIERLGIQPENNA